MIETPSAAGLEQARALAERWLPAFLAGERADDDVYADGVTTWHNIGERESLVQRTPSRTRSVGSGAELRVTDVRLRVFDGGWVVQATTVGTNAAGAPVRIPSCLVVTLRNGRIVRFEEYADSRAAESLFGILTRAGDRRPAPVPPPGRRAANPPGRGSPGPRRVDAARRCRRCPTSRHRR